MFRRKLLMIAALVGGLFVPAVANAASVRAITTADLNIRTGPGVAYERFSTIPRGDSLRVNGCLGGYGWCDVSWAGTRGWVSGKYLAYTGRRYYRRRIPTIVTFIGVPIVRYDYSDYYSRHYRHHTFHGRRFHHRGEIRHERHERRREMRHERHERRQEIRERRREHRQEARQNRRERRHEIRRDRREHRREIREDRRERRRD